MTGSAGHRGHGSHHLGAGQAGGSLCSAAPARQSAPPPAPQPPPTHLQIIHKLLNLQLGLMHSCHIFEADSFPRLAIHNREASHFKLILGRKTRGGALCSPVGQDGGALGAGSPASPAPPSPLTQTAAKGTVQTHEGADS